MTPRMLESIRKFCPRSRFGRTENSRIRRRLGCVGRSGGGWPLTPDPPWPCEGAPGELAPESRASRKRAPWARLSRRGLSLSPLEQLGRVALHDRLERRVVLAALLGDEACGLGDVGR